MKYSRPGGISMVEKPPLHTYDIYLEVEAHGGHGGIWRPFYLSYQCDIHYEYNIASIPYFAYVYSPLYSKQLLKSFKFVHRQFYHFI